MNLVKETVHPCSLPFQLPRGGGGGIYTYPVTITALARFNLFIVAF